MLDIFSRQHIRSILVGCFFFFKLLHNIAHGCNTVDPIMPFPLIPSLGVPRKQVSSNVQQENILLMKQKFLYVSKHRKGIFAKLLRDDFCCLLLAYLCFLFSMNIDYSQYFKKQ